MTNRVTEKRVIRYYRRENEHWRRGFKKFSEYFSEYFNRILRRVIVGPAP